MCIGNSGWNIFWTIRETLQQPADFGSVFEESQQFGAEEVNSLEGLEPEDNLNSWTS